MREKDDQLSLGKTRELGGSTYLGGLPDHPREGLRDRENVGEDKTGLCRRDRVTSADGEHGDGKGQAGAEEVETETELEATNVLATSSDRTTRTNAPIAG